MHIFDEGVSPLLEALWNNETGKIKTS